MKLIPLVIVLLLSVSFVVAEVKVSCETDSECYLINKDSICVENYCFSQTTKRYIAVEDFQPRNDEFDWNIVNIEPKTSVCENCLILAPEYETWYSKIINWVLFVQ